MMLDGVIKESSVLSRACLGGRQHGGGTWKHSIISTATVHVMLCDLRMNLNLFRALVSASCWSSCCDRAAPCSCRPVVSGEPSRPATATSRIKAEEAAHIKAERHKRRRHLAGRSLLNLVGADLHYKASIRRHQNTRPHWTGLFPPPVSRRGSSLVLVNCSRLVSCCYC